MTVGLTSFVLPVREKRNEKVAYGIKVTPRKKSDNPEYFR